MERRYLLFYKPYGVLTQFTDDGERIHQTARGISLSAAVSSAAVLSDSSLPQASRQTLKDFIPIPQIYPVGRLDRDSEGLLLLTNDGGLQHRLTDPKFHHPKTYWVQVERIPTVADLEPLQQGVMIKQQRTRPAIATRLHQEPDLPPRDPPIRYRKTVPTAWLEIILTEGRNRQVRRMTAAIGFPTLRLVRSAIGDLTIQGLMPGEWRELTCTEVQQLQRRSRA